MDFVFAGGTTAFDRLGLSTAFGFPDDNAEVFSAPMTGSGEVDSHLINLTPLVGALNTGCAPLTPALLSPSCQSSLCTTNTVLLRCFLAVKDRSLDAFNFYNRTEATCAEDNTL